MRTSKHLDTHCLFSVNTFFFFLIFLEIWDAGGWHTLQNLPLNRKTGSCLLTVRWWFTFWLPSWDGNAFPHSYTVFSYAFEIEPVVLPLPCHPIHLGAQHPVPHVWKGREELGSLHWYWRNLLCHVWFCCFSNMSFERPGGCVSSLELP